MNGMTSDKGKDWKRVAIVTGASSGIGEATARRFVGEGFAVVGNARGKERLKAMQKELGEAFVPVAGDAGDDKLIAKLFDTAAKKFGRAADLVVANAGRGLGGSVTSADVERFREIERLNVSGTLSLMQQAARTMLPRQQEHFPQTAADIVVIGSVVGRNISPFSAVYGSTKFAVAALAEGLRREIGPQGVRVTLVEPGVVISGFQEAAGYDDEQVHRFHEDFGPLIYGEEVADAIHYIVSRAPHVHVNNLMVRPVRQTYP